MTRQEGFNILSTKLFLLIGSAAGLTQQFWKDADLVLGVILKFVSIISFVIVIVLNIPKLRRYLHLLTKFKKK